MPTFVTNLPIPSTIKGIDLTNWETYRPYFTILQQWHPQTDEEILQWVSYWSDLSRFTSDAVAEVQIQSKLDTADPDRERAFTQLVTELFPPLQEADQALKEKLLTFDLSDAGLEIMLRNLKNEADLFSQENLALFPQISQLSQKYDKITGALSAEYNGKLCNYDQLATYLGSKDRAVREEVWQIIMTMWQENRADINQVYLDLLPLRQQVAENAGEDDFRAYTYRSRNRFAYTPEDCMAFHDAIEQVIVPVAQRIMERKRQQMGVDSIKPWDWIPELSKVVEPSTAPALAPFKNEAELVAGGRALFTNLDPQLGEYVAIMDEANLLDLDTRQGKALGGFCYPLAQRKIPFIFMNSTGTNRDLQTFLHEAGHAFHAFEAYNQKYLHWQDSAPLEFCEVASMSMELLAAPYLTKDQGGYYNESEAARHRIQDLETSILFFPFMSIVDSFQHWVYTHIDEIESAEQLDAKWDELWQRFLPGVDWTGFEEIRKSGWHRKLHIFRYPFYYIEYGMAQIGSYQVWRNSLQDAEQTLAQYRTALALGGTKPLPELFEAIGAEFRFDVPMLTQLMVLLENQLEELGKIAQR